MKFGKKEWAILFSGLSIYIICGLAFLLFTINTDSTFEPDEIGEIRQEFPYYEVPAGYVEISASKSFGDKTISIHPEQEFWGTRIQISLLGSNDTYEQAKNTRFSEQDGFGGVCVSNEEQYFVSSEINPLNATQSELRTYVGDEAECGFRAQMVIYYFQVNEKVGTVRIAGAIDQWNQEAIDYFVESFNNPP